MVQPGDQAGDCPRCGSSMVCIGWGHSVIGSHCSDCDLTVIISGDAATSRDVREDDLPDRIEGSPVGPDPNP